MELSLLVDEEKPKLIFSIGLAIFAIRLAGPFNIPVFDKKINKTDKIMKMKNEGKKLLFGIQPF